MTPFFALFSYMALKAKSSPDCQFSNSKNFNDKSDNINNLRAINRIMKVLTFDQ